MQQQQEEEEAQVTARCPPRPEAGAAWHQPARPLAPAADTASRTSRNATVSLQKTRARCRTCCCNFAAPAPTWYAGPSPKPDHLC